MRLLAMLVTVLMLVVAKALRWLGQYLEDSVAKDKDALAELDKAIDEVEAYVASDEDTDAAAINERVNRLRGLLAPGPGQPIDSLTGTPVPINNEVGPTSPNLDPGAAPQTTSDPGAVTQEGELVEPDVDEHPESNNR